MVPSEEYVGSAYQKQSGKTLPETLFDAIELAKNSEFVSSIVPKRTYSSISWRPSSPTGRAYVDAWRQIPCQPLPLFLTT
jgi:glutamine synthetase